MKKVLSLILVFVIILGIIPSFGVLADAVQDTTADKIPMTLDTSTSVHPWGAVAGKWLPMYNTGDGLPNDGTWCAWDSTHYAEIVEEGHADAGALHLVSASHKNTGVGINPGLTVGETYTLGLWAKGTSNSGKVLATVVNGDFVIIGSNADLGADWTYYETTFTATASVFNLVAADWGETDIYVDNITIKNSAGVDLLAGYGDFCMNTEVASDIENIRKTAAVLDATKLDDSYDAPTDEWVPFTPYAEYKDTWPVWETGVNYGEIVAEGYKDAGALHLVSAGSKNTGVVINPQMVSGETYTIGMWVKGTSNSNKILEIYGNNGETSNVSLIGNPTYCGDVCLDTLPAEWTYIEKSFTANRNSLAIFAADWGVTDIFIDNITLKNTNGFDLIAGMGDFSATLHAIDASKVSSAYKASKNVWTPFCETATWQGTWPAWMNGINYGEIVEVGKNDAGALHLKSAETRNTGVATDAGMISGETYTLGMWVKGSTNNPNKVLALYGNGSGTLVGSTTYSADGHTGCETISDQWTYLEKTFVADRNVLIILAPDWGANDVYIDNISLKDSSGCELLGAKGCFCVPVTTEVKNANFDFEYNNTGMPQNWKLVNVLAETTAEVYSENVYSGNSALRVHRQNGELDCSFLYSQSYIPVCFGDEIELTAHIASRNSISGSFSLFVHSYGEPDQDMIEYSYGQERITNASDDWSQWDTYELTYTVPKGVKYLRFGMRIGGTEAEVLIDDLVYYNYTQNCNLVYNEDFSAPSALTGYPGGWNGTGITVDKDVLQVSGNAETNLFCLRTDNTYALAVNVDTTHTGTGTLVMEAVNWNGQSGGEVLNVGIDQSNKQLYTEFTAVSGVYYRLRVESIEGTIAIDNIDLYWVSSPVNDNTVQKAEKAPASAVPTTTSSVETVGGKTYLLVNGEPTVPMWYARPEAPFLFETHTVTEFAEAGIDTVVTYVFMNNNYGDVWTKDGFVSDAIDDMMLSTLAGNPNAKFIVTLDFTAPQWWCEENPGELAALENSTPERTNASFASEKWKNESGEIALQAIDYLMSQSYADQIIGFKVTGGYTLEWNWWALSGAYNDVGDFSECGIQAFRQWLTEKYGNDSALQAAYGDANITLQNAMPPSAELRRDDYLDTVIQIQTHPEMMDYELYMAELKADTIEYFAALVKDAVDDRLIVGTYAGYFYMGGGYEFTSAVANVYFQRLLQSENIDYIKSPWAYGMREIGDSAEFMGPVDSLDLYGKLWIVEDDSRLNLQMQAGNQDDNAAVGWTRNYQQSVEQLKRNFSYVLSKGMGISFYNLMWNFTDDDQYYGVIAQMYEEMEKSLCITSQSTADIAIFVDGESQMLIPYEEEVANSVLHLSILKEQLEELGHIGASYDMYLLDDLKDGLVPEHKINIFLATTMITQEEREAIESQLQKNDNILVWIFTDGISDGTTTDIALMEELTGMNLSVVSTERRHTATAQISNTGHWLTTGLKNKQHFGVESYDKLSPMISILDPSVTSLAYHTDTWYVAMGVKDMGDWTSVYSAIPNLPQSIFRNMLNHTGCHIYTDSPSDVIYANSDYVALHSIFAGERTINLPQKSDVYDAFTGEIIARDTDVFTVTLSGKETRLFRLTSFTAAPEEINSSAMSSANSASEQWTPMYPTGTPDSGTWIAWDSVHYGEVVQDGKNDIGALHLISAPHKNTGVAIEAGMTPGDTYKLCMWVKGTADNINKVLALYGNGDGTIVGLRNYSTDGHTSSSSITDQWAYVEKTFVADRSQLNVIAVDWGNSEIYLDNIALYDSQNNDLLAGKGDFWSYQDQDNHNYIGPTCTKPEICFACGQIGTEAIGHSYSEWETITAATLQQSGQQQRECLHCGDKENKDIPCLANVESWNLTLGGDLSVNFVMDIHEDIADTAEILITVAGVEYRYEAAEMVSVNVAAAQMTDTITVQIINGEDASAVREYSVVRYAKEVLANESLSDYHSIIKAMLSYGDAAQTYFAYNTDNRIDVNLEDASNEDVSSAAVAEMKVSGAENGISFYGASLLFRNKIAVRYYFTTSGDIGDYEFTVNEIAYKPEVKDGLYYIEVSDINPQDLDDAIIVVVNKTLTVSYSPMNYIVRMSTKGSENLKALMKAIYNYYLVAEQFVN